MFPLLDFILPMAKPTIKSTSKQKPNKSIELAKQIKKT